MQQNTNNYDRNWTERIVKPQSNCTVVKNCVHLKYKKKLTVLK